MNRMLRFSWLVAVGLFGMMGCSPSASTSNGPATGAGTASGGPYALPAGSIYGPQSETSNRAPSGAASESQYAVGFQGRQCVELAESSELLDLDGDFTVEAWVRLPTNSTTTVHLVGSEQRSPVQGTPDALTGGWALQANLSANFDDAGADILSAIELELVLATPTNQPFTVKAAKVPNDEQWRHVAASRVGNEARLYVNGKLVGQKVIDVQLAPGSKPVTLGLARDTDLRQPDSMELAVVRISSVARYPESFNRLASLEADKDTLALLDFRTGEGKDLSGDGHDGVFYGAKWIALEGRNQPALDRSSAPEAPPPPGVDLGKAFFALRHNEHGDFHQMLRQLRSVLPKIEVVTADAPIQWTTVTLNEHAEHLGALRFTSSSDEPADLRWCFVFPANIIQQWSIVGLERERGEGGGIGPYAAEYFVDIENLEEPEASCAVFQRIEGGVIEPFREYTVWFAFATDKPVTMSFAMRALPSSDPGEELPTSAAIARELGLSTPLRFKQPETADGFVARASITGRQNAAIGVNWVEKGLQQWPHDRGLLRTAIAMHERRAMTLAQAGELPLAAPYFLKAASYAEALESEFSDLTGAERQLVARAFYNRACSQTLGGETDHALASLREALEVGFADLKTLETDSDLADLRGAAGYRELVESLRSQLRPPDKLDYELKAHPDDAVEFNGHWYKHYATSLPWHLAQLRCKEEGGYLACLESAEEADFVQKQWSEVHLWPGGIEASPGMWRWINGQPFTATRWAPGEPKASRNEEVSLRLEIGPEGRWFAASNASQSIRGYVCEWER